MESKEVRHFPITDGVLPETPVIITDFDADQDVLVLAGNGLSRNDLQFEQRANETAVLLRKNRKELAILENTNAFDLDPAALLNPFYEALFDGKTETVLGFLAEDIYWEVAGPTDIMPWAGGRRGVKEVKEYFDLLNDGLAYERLVPTRFIAQGNTVAVVLDGNGKTLGGKSFSGGVVHWVTVRNGKISHLQCYRDAYPVMEAICGGRPFTVQSAKEGSHYYTVKPVAASRNSDSIVFETPGSAKPDRTVASVMAMYGALQRLEVNEMRQVFADNVIWNMYGPSDLIAWSGKWVGPEAAMQSVKAIIQTLNFEHFQAVRMIHQGDTAAVLVDEPGSSKASGLPFHTSVAHIVTANAEGKIAQFTNYVNTACIVEAFLGGRPFTVA